MSKVVWVFFFCTAATWAVPLEGSKKIVPLKDVGSRIINGVAAVPGQLPWQAAIYFQEASGTYFCGGALIGTQWVLTAGHCVQGAKIFDVVLGITSLSEPNRTVITTSLYVIHDSYDPRTLENDIGLIRFLTVVTMTDLIMTIPVGGAVLNGGVAVTVSGWGYTSGEATAISDSLNYVNLTTITNLDCSNYFGDNVVKPGMVCAVGDSLKSTCSGDSGGALFTGSGISAIHVGIVSWVSSAGCAKGFPSGYTRTDVYRYWIKQRTGI